MLHLKMKTIECQTEFEKKVNCGAQWDHGLQTHSKDNFVNACKKDITKNSPKKNP